MKKGILIDVNSKTISYVNVTKNDGSYLESIYAHLKCNMVEIVIFGVNDIYVNEEGLLFLKQQSMFFMYKGQPQPYSGNGLILGYDEKTGDSVDTTLTVEEVRNNVRFLNIHEVQLSF